MPRRVALAKAKIGVGNAVAQPPVEDLGGAIQFGSVVKVKGNGNAGGSGMGTPVVRAAFVGALNGVVGVLVGIHHLG